MFLHPNSVASVILGGGEGRRLFPLTRHRAKPALPCGEFRIIDVPISHSLNAGIRRIFVLTQFLSVSLHRHLIDTYQLDGFSQGFLEILAPEQRPGHAGWYLGTADAVRQNIEYLRQCDAEYFLILSGDQIYTANFPALLKQAFEGGADLTISALLVGAEDAPRMGILETDGGGRATNFFEKPEEIRTEKRFIANKTFLQKQGIQRDKGNNYLASMGIYVFKRQALFNLLEEDLREDFGKHLIPSQIKKGSVQVYLHQGYWEDIGTIETLHRANMALTRHNSPFAHAVPGEQIYKRSLHLPAPKIIAGEVKESIFCAGSIVDAKRVANSVIGVRVCVERDSVVEESVLFGNEKEGAAVVGPGCVIRRAIFDKNVRLGAGVQLINRDRHRVLDADPVYIRDGIIVVTEGAHLPAGFVL